MKKNLNNIHKNYNTDKGIHHNYIPVYENMFCTNQSDTLNILEIGIFNGGSLKMWNDYFVNSKIYGIDNFSHGIYKNKTEKITLINELTSYSDRITVFESDSKTFNLNLNFDIIIDDGDHSTDSIIKTFINLYKNLNISGYYIIEDPKSLREASIISEFILLNFDVNLEILPLNIKYITDDILIMIKKIT